MQLVVACQLAGRGLVMEVEVEEAKVRWEDWRGLRLPVLGGLRLGRTIARRGINELTRGRLLEPELGIWLFFLWRREGGEGGGLRA